MYKRVLLPLDGSDMAEQALSHAVVLAERFDAELVLLRILEPFPNVRGLSVAQLVSIRQQENRWAKTYFDQITVRLRDRAVAIETAIVEGNPRTLILEYAEENQVDLIVICSRGRSGLSRWLIGSVADRVMRGAAVPVLLVNAQQKEQ